MSTRTKAKRRRDTVTVPRESHESMAAQIEGLKKWVREYDAAQALFGDERRQAEGNAAARLRGWVLREYP